MFIGIGLFCAGVLMRVYTWAASSETPISVSVWTESLNEVLIAWELRVSPYNIQDKLVHRLTDTKYTLDMRMYSFSWKEMEQLLKNLASMWIGVRRIGENKPFGWSDKNFIKLRWRLEEYGIKVIDDEKIDSEFNHAKAIILDDEKFLISTGNFTFSSISKNREYWFIWSNVWVVQSLKNIFEKDFTGKRLKNTDIHLSLIVCPLNCRQTIQDKIAWANVSIDISTQYLQDEKILSLLKKRAEEIPVRILVWFWQDAWRLDEFDMWVAKVLPDPYLHTKNILIDGSLLLHGSINLSQNSLDNNREIGIMIDDPKVIQTFTRSFEWDRERWVNVRDWEFSSW